LDITTYTAHSASKFDETDFVYLKALWKNHPVTGFHIHNYVREDYVSRAEQLAGLKPSPPAEQGQPVDQLRQSLSTFINTIASPYKVNEPLTVQLGVCLIAKRHIEQLKAANHGGRYVGEDTPKLRRSERLKNRQREAAERAAAEARAAAEENQLDALAGQVGGLAIQEERAVPLPQTPPESQFLGGPEPALVATPELDVISPESLQLEKARSRDEEIVNQALVDLLTAATVASGIGIIPGRDELAWSASRQAFQLGRAEDPVCEARTDGLLYKTGDPDCALAILEVKPYIRNSNQAKIEWQEACQMAAWISSSLHAPTAEKRRAGILSTSDNNNRRRVLISQDYQYLYITIGEWGRGYEEYLLGGRRPETPPSRTSSPSRNRGPAKAARVAARTAAAGPAPGAPVNAESKSTAPGQKQPKAGSDPGREFEATAEDLDPDNFLIMNCYGPYNLQDRQHVGAFIRNVLALMLELSDPWE
ncbi:uncharacterized protein THITE_2053475, partial [Thermothielavioides terrestris NRRL 8126]